MLKNYYKIEQNYPQTYQGTKPLDDSWKEFTKTTNEDGTITYSPSELDDSIKAVELSEFQAKFRAERDSLLQKVDIEINKALDNNLDVTILRTYRQALRDATNNWVMPENILGV